MLEDRNVGKKQLRKKAKLCLYGAIVTFSLGLIYVLLGAIYYNAEQYMASFYTMSYALIFFILGTAIIYVCLSYKMTYDIVYRDELKKKADIQNKQEGE